MRKNLIIIYISVVITIFIISTSMSTLADKLVENNNIKLCQTTDGQLEVNGEAEFESTGFFYVKQKNNVWWFVDPDGNKFYSHGVLGVDPGYFFYGNFSKWINTTRQRLNEWGINTITGSSELDMPYLARFKFKDLARVRDSWPDDRFPDVFDPWWQETVNKTIIENASRLRNDSNLIGYYTDNEMKWGPDISSSTTLLELYMAGSPEAPGKRELVRLLSNRYNNNTETFNRVWRMSIKDFDDLYNHSRLGREGWRIKSGQAKSDIYEFSKIVTEIYFNVTNSALKSADPNHLNLGVRFHLYGVPVEVLEICSKYVDVISINDYRPFFITNVDFLRAIKSFKYDSVPMHYWFKKYYEISGKPIIISEFNIKCDDGSLPTNTLFLQLAQNQNTRADIFGRYARKCLKTPYVIGLHWFCYRDNFFDNSGIVDLWDEPYTPLVNQISNITKKTMEIHKDTSFILENQKITQIDLNKLSQNVINFQKIIATDLSVEKELLAKSKIHHNFYDNKDKKLQHQLLLDIKNIKKIHYVNNIGTSDYSSIQDAINNALEGDTVFVHNGEYNEKIIINKSINLVGEDPKKTIICGFYEDKLFTGYSNFNNYVITIEADNVTIEGFNITTTIDSWHYNCRKSCSGIYILNQTNCSILGNIFYKLGWNGCIFGRKVNNIRINNNSFNNSITSAIILDSSNNTIIYHNNFQKNGICNIWISSSRNTKIENNHLFGCAYGIILWKANNNNIIFNDFKVIEQKKLCLKESKDNIIFQNNFMKVKHLIETPTSFYCNGNTWDGNYWGRPRILPKCIFGKTEKSRFTTIVNFDHNPAIKPYEI